MDANGLAERRESPATVQRSLQVQGIGSSGGKYLLSLGTVN